MEAFAYRGGRLMAESVSVQALARKHGTPLYVYDTSKMTEQYKRLRKAFSVKKLDIHYACKALTNINVLKHMHSLGAGADCVSVQEIKLALKAGFTKEQILYTPNCVSIKEIEDAIALGVRINIDNIETLEYLGHHHKDVPISISSRPGSSGRSRSPRSPTEKSIKSGRGGVGIISLNS